MDSNESSAALSGSELMRYDRHLRLPEIGVEGQFRLKRGSVLVIGAGGLGSPVCLYLAAAGVGRIGVADGDCLDLSNLQRQVVHRTSDLGRNKAISAADAMHALNPDVTVTPYTEMLTSERLSRLASEYDFVIDATDSSSAKCFIDRICVAAGRPYCHGAIWRWEGQVMTVLPGTPGYCSAFGDSEAECHEAPAGPVGAVAGVVGCIQAAEAVKYIVGAGDLLVGRLLCVDMLHMTFVTLPVG